LTSTIQYPWGIESEKSKKQNRWAKCLPVFFRETLIKCLATACTADLAHSFGKNTQNTTSILALFACIMHQIHRHSQRQTFISVSFAVWHPAIKRVLCRLK
jgi:hypothetical protein